MESVLEIKNRIHHFIENADERILRVINAIVISEEGDDVTLTTEHKTILDERLRDHQENPKDGESWEEVKDELAKEYGF